MVIPGVSIPDSHDKFLVLLAQDGQSFRNGNIFAIYRDFLKPCACDSKVAPQPDSSLMIIAGVTSMASHLKNISVLAGIPVSCAPHSILNQSHSVVYSLDLFLFSCETLLEELPEGGGCREG